jgi:UDP-2,4-diacetamido-2,4,6-trideoxy-beta-L-altropyranose hydrolase
VKYLRAAARVDAGAEIGVGHLRRCVTLLKRLRNDGCSVRLVSRTPLPASLAGLLAGIPVLSLSADSRSPMSEDDDAAMMLQAIGPEASWVVVDHYGLAERWERRVKDAGHAVLVLDDFRHRRHHADVLVSDSALPFDPALNGAPARVLLGHRYALIEDDFAPAPNPPRAGRTVLVSYGGSDPSRETVKALAAIERVQRRQPDAIDGVDVVIGPLNPAQGELLRQVAGIDGATVHVAPASLAPMMRRADLVMTAAGNSMVEALSVRRWCLVTVVADNQRSISEELQRAGAIDIVGDSATVTVEGLDTALTDALQDYQRLAQRAANQSIFDTHGASRISAAMLEQSA